MLIEFNRQYTENHTENLTRDVPTSSVAYQLQKEYINNLAAKEFGTKNPEKFDLYCYGIVRKRDGKLWLDANYYSRFSHCLSPSDKYKTRELTQKEIVIINSLDLLREEFKDD